MATCLEFRRVLFRSSPVGASRVIPARAAVRAASPHAPVSPLRLVSPPKGPSMLVRTLDQVTDTDDDIKTENWRSKRIILAKEGVGVSVHETTLRSEERRAGKEREPRGGLRKDAKK